MASQQSKQKWVIDPSSAAEGVRLLNQDRLVTKVVGGLLPAQLDLSRVHTVLDVACGSGSWSLELARAFPSLRVVGIDLSPKMIESADLQAATVGLSNALFTVMDARKPLGFAAASFGVVHARFLQGMLLQEDWGTLACELVRVLAPGGTLVWREWNDLGHSNSLAFSRYTRWIAQALHRAGRAPLSSSASLVRQSLLAAGFERLERQAHLLSFGAQDPAHEGVAALLRPTFALLIPFLLEQQVASRHELEEGYENVLVELMSPGFQGQIQLLTTLARAPQGTQTRRRR